MAERKKKSGLGYIPWVGVAAIAIGGGAAAYFFLKGAPTGQKAALASAKVVPESALAAAYISIDPKPWSKLEQFGTPEAQDVVRTRFEGFRQNFLAQTNVDLETDLQPWVGGVMFAVVSPAESIPPSEEPNLLMVASIKNKLKALEFAKKMKAQQEGSTTEREYKGVTITEMAQEDGTTYNTAVLDDRLVLAMDGALIEQAVETFKGEPSFADKPEAAKMIRQGVKLENSLAQLYVADYKGFMGQVASASTQGEELSPGRLEQLESVESVVMGLGVDDGGLRFKTIAQLDPSQVEMTLQPSPGQEIKRFPASTIALLSGGGISQTWSDLVAQTAENPELQQLIGQVRRSFQQVDLDADGVFGWMDGEFAIGVVPSKTGILASTGFGGAIVLETSDRSGADATLKQLSEMAKKMLPVPLSVTQKEVGGIEISEWSVPQAPNALVGHGWLSDRSLLVALGGPIVEVMVPAPDQPLKGSENFELAAGPLPQQNLGYFYVNLEEAMSIVNDLPPEALQLSPDASAILNSIRGLGLTVTVPGKSESLLEMSLTLKSKEQAVN